MKIFQFMPGDFRMTFLVLFAVHCHFLHKLQTLRVTVVQEKASPR